MKFAKYVLTLLVLLPTLSWAGLNLAEPKELISKAAQNRMALRDVILDIEMNLSEMRDQGTFEKYFVLLDELKVLAVQFKMDEYYPQLVEGLGLHMVSNGMRWLDVTKDAPGKLLYYVKWMNADSLSRFLGAIEYQLSSVKDRTRLAAMATNIEALLPLIDKRAPDDGYLQSGYRRLSTEAAVAILKDPTLSLQDSEFWIGKVKIAASLSDYVDYLTQEILNLGSDRKDLGKNYLQLLLLVNLQIYKDTTTPPSMACQRCWRCDGRAVFVFGAL